VEEVHLLDSRHTNTCGSLIATRRSPIATRLKKARRGVTGRDDPAVVFAVLGESRSASHDRPFSPPFCRFRRATRHELRSASHDPPFSPPFCRFRRVTSHDRRVTIRFFTVQVIKNGCRFEPCPLFVFVRATCTRPWHLHSTAAGPPEEPTRRVRSPKVVVGPSPSLAGLTAPHRSESTPSGQYSPTRP
jgi:hypothetical protein